MITLSAAQKELVTSGLKFKLAELEKLHKVFKGGTGPNMAEAEKAVLKELTLCQELFREIELSKKQ